MRRISSSPPDLRFRRFFLPQSRLLQGLNYITSILVVDFIFKDGEVHVGSFEGEDTSACKPPCPGGSALWQGLRADLHLDYDKYTDDEGNLYYVENSKGRRKDSQEPATFGFIFVLHRIHLEISIGLNSDFAVYLSK